MGFPGSSDSKEYAFDVEGLGLIPGLGRSPGGGHGNRPHYPCLESTHEQRSVAGYTVHGVAKSRTQLGD